MPRINAFIYVTFIFKNNHRKLVFFGAPQNSTLHKSRMRVKDPPEGFSTVTPSPKNVVEKKVYVVKFSYFLDADA